MSKNFSDHLESGVQPEPTDLLISRAEKKESDKVSQKTDTAVLIKKAFDIIENFTDLDPKSRVTVLEKLKEIVRLDQSNLPEGDFLTIEQAAAFLNVSDRTIRNYLKKGKIQGTKKGKRWFFTRSEVEKMK